MSYFTDTPLQPLRMAHNSVPIGHPSHACDSHGPVVADSAGLRFGWLMRASQPLCLPLPCRARCALGAGPWNRPLTCTGATGGTWAGRPQQPACALTGAAAAPRDALVTVTWGRLSDFFGPGQVREGGASDTELGLGGLLFCAMEGSGWCGERGVAVDGQVVLVLAWLECFSCMAGRTCDMGHGVRPWGI